MLKLFALLICLALQYVNGLNNGLALTPPMGWLSWERFTCNVDCITYPHDCINEQLYKDMADRIVADGYKAVGYEYVNIDDCWSEMERDLHTHKLVPDKKRFPSGMKALADYVHSKGLKLGIYGDVGPKTCDGYPSQNGPGEGYFTIDAKTFAEWDIDSFKFDGCNEDPHKFPELFPKMERALNASGRKILYSCEWPLYQYIQKITPNYTDIAKTCNLYRNHEDIHESFESVKSIIEFYGNNGEEFSKYNGPGNWLDPDMLIIGNFALSLELSRTQMSMWSLWSSPLYMSNDLRHLEPGFKKILQNKKLIAINQDPHGIMGKRIYNKDNLQIWIKPVDPIIKGVHSYGVVYLDTRNEGNRIYRSVNLSEFLPHDTPQNTTFIAHNLFEEKDDVIGHIHFNESLRLLTGSGYCVQMVKLTPVS